MSPKISMIYKYSPTKAQKNRWRWMKLKYLLVCLTGMDRIRYLKKRNIFALLGENVTFQPLKLPNAPERIKIHDNVRIAADVQFYEHDIINNVFAVIDDKPYSDHHTCIEIFDNVFIGGGQYNYRKCVDWT